MPYDAAVVARIARLPLVKQVTDFTIVDPDITPLGSHGLHLSPGESPPNIGGSFDGQFSTVDRVTLTTGRLADPRRANEVVMNAGAAHEFGVHVGSILPVGFYTNNQQSPGLQPPPGTKLPPPHLKVDLDVVGIVVFHTQVIEDDVDRLADTWVLLTPALMRELVPCCAFVTETTMTVDGGNRNAAAVEAEIVRAVPKLKAFSGGGGANASMTAVEEAKAERAIEPESIALGVFGAIAALAVLLIAGQLIGRQLRLGADERAVLRSLGASPAMTVGDGLLGIFGAVVAGALLAGVVAVGISPLTPLGPVRYVEHSGIAFDWTVLGLGLATVVVVLSAAAVVLAYRQAPHRIAGRRPGVRARGSRAGRAAANAGLPTSAVTGIRFALEPGAGPNAVPVRSAIVGAVLALVVLTSTVTFGTSLRTLVSRPALYGWNWNYQLLSGFSGQEDLPAHQVQILFDQDTSVSAWTGVYFAAADIDGRSVPVIGATPNAPVAPPLLSGHGLNAPDEVVLGASTLTALHKHVGDAVQVRAGPTKTTTLRIVGTATLPAIGPSGNHTTMGTGAIVDYQVIPANRRNQQQSTIPGPQAILIRVRPGANPTAALRSLQQITNTLDKSPDGPVSGVVGVLRPAEIVNYRSMGTTPALLGAALAFGAVAALVLTLIASVRRRRRELALLKTLGFTRRQLAAVVAWQSTVAVTLGVVVGVPVGILTGRALWDLFAAQIHVVPDPTVPALTIAVFTVGAFVLANLVAAIPGLQAARTHTALLLHAE
ncbi:MAG: FtsX-like permease family protein [Acidimicrobiia bacterium]